MQRTPEQQAEHIVKCKQWEMEKFKKRAPCPYGVVTFDGWNPELIYLSYDLIIDEKYVMKDGLHPLVKKWIRNNYVAYEPVNWKKICLIVS